MNAVFFLLPFLIAAALALPSPGWAADWNFEMHGGAPVVPDRNVHITQAGQPDLDFSGHFRSDAFKMPYYYDFRLIRWQEARGWALDFLHAKLVLENGPPEVEDFQLTHGYNMVSLQRLWSLRHVVVMAGAGVVVTHAESTVRGRTFDQHQGLFDLGYYISGPLAVAGAGRRLDLGSRVYLSGDVRLSLSHVRVEVVDGHGSLTDLQIHFLGGAGLRF